MKLSDFKGEKAIEVLADIMIPVSGIISDEEVKKMLTAKGIPYMQVVGYILKNHASKVLDMYEALMQEPKEKATPVKLTQMVIDIFADPELNSLFTSQSQDEALTPFGSVMANTEDGLK